MADLALVADVKKWLGLTSTTDDALLARLVTAASAAIESYLNRTFEAKDYEGVFDGLGNDRLMPPNYPLLSITSVSVNDEVIPRSLSATAPGWVASSTMIMLRWPYRFEVGVQNVKVSYRAGFESIPTDVAQACIELCALRYEDRKRIGITSKGLAGETISFSQKDFSNPIKTVLQQYKRVVPV